MQDTLHLSIEPTVIGLGYELLGIERGRTDGGQLVRVFIDSANGISAHDCETVSRQISDVMDVEDMISGDYVLEVSSPGIDRPLFTLAQHAKYLGEKVKVRLGTLIQGRRRITGVLKEVTEDSILIQIDGGDIYVPFIEIERSHLTDTSYDFSGKQT